jgi:hypothetical protein
MELYFSVDVETDGPIPGPNSMLSFGCVVLDEKGVERGTFEANLELLEGASPDLGTAAWWKTQPEAWAACRKNLENPELVMKRFCGWVDAFKDKGHKPVMVCFPAGFDFLFMYWYMMRFAKHSPFSFSCIDMKTYAMALLGTSYRGSSKRSWPKHWFPNLPHTHVAIDDAREQVLTFINMLNANQQMGDRK